MRACFIILLMTLFIIDGFCQISIHNLLGKWEMNEVYQSGRKVTHQYIPDASRWITFRSDNTFVSYGEPYGHKEGRYSLDESTGLLSFDMDLGFGQKSFWQVEYDGQKMIWYDRGNPRIDQIKIILVPDY